MNLGKSVFRILLLTCFLLLVAWVSMKLLQTGGDPEALLREFRQEYGHYIEDTLRFLREKVLPAIEKIVKPAREFIEQKLAGR